MSAVAIRAAFEQRLALMPALATAYENVDYVPIAGTPYQRVNLIPATPDNQSMGQTYYQELGLLQVTLFYPMNKGANAAQARAELIKTHFKRSTSMTQSGLIVQVTKTPTISPAFFDGDRYCIAVRIYYMCNIFL